MRRAEEEEKEESETDILWWKKCEALEEVWSFSGSAARMPNDSSGGPKANALWL